MDCSMIFIEYKIISESNNYFLKVPSVTKSFYTYSTNIFDDVSAKNKPIN